LLLKYITDGRILRESRLACNLVLASVTNAREEAVVCREHATLYIVDTSAFTPHAHTGALSYRGTRHSKVLVSDRNCHSICILLELDLYARIL